MALPMAHALLYFVFYFACFMLKGNHVGHWLSETCLSSLLSPEKIKFRIFDHIYLYIFSKKKFCSRPQEIYFRHLVRRELNYVFFWPNDLSPRQKVQIARTFRLRLKSKWALLKLKTFQIDSGLL